MGIQRWHNNQAFGNMFDCVDGDYVLFTDHEQVVAELKERIDAYHIGQVCDKEEIARQAITIRNLRAALAATHTPFKRTDR